MRDGLFSTTKKEIYLPQTLNSAIEGDKMEVPLPALPKGKEGDHTSRDGMEEHCYPATMPLQRSQTDSWNNVKAREKELHRRSSYGMLKRDKTVPAATSAKAARKLQLPSFKLLGIAAPFPKGASFTSKDTPANCRLNPPHFTSADFINTTPNQTHPTSRDLPQPAFGTTPPLTPPEDSDSIKWNSISDTQHNKHGQISTCSMDSHLVPDLDGLKVTAVATTETAGAMSLAGEQRVMQTQNHEMSGSSTDNHDGAGLNSGAWLDDAIGAAGKLLFSMPYKFILIFV